MTTSSLTTTLAGYASKTVANTYTALQTFSSGLTSTGVITANGGLTVPSGQTLTLTGATTVATTQAIGNNTTNVATTAFVNIYGVPKIITHTAVGDYGALTITTMRTIYILAAGSTGTTPMISSLNTPPQTLIGAMVTFFNFSTHASGLTILITAPSKLWNVNFLDRIIIPQYTSKTLMFLGS